MLNVSTLTTALHGLLVAAIPTATVERSTRINFDPARCPWVGVYPGAVSSAPRTASGGAQWKDEVELQVVAQTGDLGGDGTEASDELEALVTSVLDTVNASLTLGVVGARVVGMSREYRYVIFDNEGSGDLFMPQAVIRLKLEVRSS